MSGTSRGRLGLLASRRRELGRSDHAPLYDVNIDVTVDAADDFLTGTSRDTTPEQGTIHLERESSSYPEWARPQAGDRIEALGSWVWDCDHYQGRTARRRSSIPSARPGSAGIRAPSPRAPRGEAEGDLFISTDPTPAGKQAECAHRDEGQRPVQGVLARGAATGGASTGRTLRALRARSAPGRRPPRRSRLVDKGSSRVAASAVTARKDGCADVVLTVDAAGRQARRRRVAGLRRLVEGDAEGRPPAAALRPPARAARDGSQLRARQAGVPGEERVDAARADRERPGRVAAPLERRRHLGALARDARRRATARSSRARSRSTSTSSAAGSGRSSRSRASATSARCPAGTAPGHPMAPCPLTTEIGNSKGDDYPGAIAVTYRGAALGRHVTNAATAGSSCPPSNTHGCYQLTYTVSRVR